MKKHAIPRRTFLKQASAGAAAGAAVLQQILAVHRAFAAKLSALPAAKRTGGAVDFAALRQAYSLSPGVTYFNHGSIGTIPKIVQEAHQKYLEICETNPWLYMWGGAWEELRTRVREKAAGLMGADAGEIALTHNTTEGFNLLAQGLPLKAGDEVLFSSLNHPGASICWFHQAKVKGFTVNRFDFPVLQAPRLSEEDILNLYDHHISPKTRVLVFPHVDNMVGLRHPVKALAQLGKSKGVDWVAVDGAQSLGMIPVNMQQLGVDFYAASPHKWVQAPKGLGLMYIRKAVQQDLRPMWVTWGQNRWKGTVRIFEDYGTRNLPEVLAMGDAIAFQQKLGARAREQRLKHLWAYFKNNTRQRPHLAWFSPVRWELSASLYAIEVKNHKSQQVFETLFKKYGFVFRPFHSEALNTLRISPNVFNTIAEMDRFFERLDAEFAG